MQNFRKIYLTLIVLRLLFAVLGTGYIHPDEYFQNGEVMAADILELYTTRTWEWISEAPVRSIVPPYLTTGVVFGLVRLLRLPNPRMIHTLERLYFFVLSFVLDFTVYNLVPHSQRRRATVLLASSHVMFSFQVRPFSNTIEAVILALCLVQLRDFITMVRLNRKPILALCILAVLITVGAFTRITILAFTLPIGLQVLYWTGLRGNFLSYPSFWLKQLICPVLLASLVASVFIIADTHYYGGDHTHWIVTPWNFLGYNMISSNLVSHGIHPRWLHAVVNLPMIVGPGLLWLGMQPLFKFAFSKPQLDDSQIINQTCAWIVISSISILSMQPHQEPRFLLPLLTPILILAHHTYSQAKKRERRSSRVARPFNDLSKLFWLTWISFNALASIFFGVLHQGAVIPSLYHLHDKLSSLPPDRNATIVYWKTLMPPPHILALNAELFNSGRFAIIDVAGQSQEIAMSTLSQIPMSRQVFLLTPLALESKLPSPIRDCIDLENYFFPHLDMDHLPETWEAGIPKGLSLGLWHVRTRCLNQIDI